MHTKPKDANHNKTENVYPRKILSAVSPMCTVEKIHLVHIYKLCYMIFGTETCNVYACCAS